MRQLYANRRRHSRARNEVAFKWATQLRILFAICRVEGDLELYDISWLLLRHSRFLLTRLSMSISKHRRDRINVLFILYSVEQKRELY